MLKNASDEQLIGSWTTVTQFSPRGIGGTLRRRYENWKRLRTPAPAAAPAVAAPTAERRPGAGGATGAGGSAPATPPPSGAVGRDEWRARVSFQTFVIDTSDQLERQLLWFAGGLFSDSNATTAGSTAVRDNNEWLEWRTIVRERIPRIDKAKIIEAIGATSDPQAAIVRCGTQDTMSGLAYDEERYAVDRGINSNFNLDRITSGGEGMALDNAMGDYQREVLTSITGPDYGTITRRSTRRRSTPIRRASARSGSTSRRCAPRRSATIAAYHRRATGRRPSVRGGQPSRDVSAAGDGAGRAPRAPAPGRHPGCRRRTPRTRR